MANKKYEETDIQAIAEAIREKTGSEDSYKVSDMANGINEVYEAGKRKGWSDFWDAYQKNGNKSDYSYAFYSWNDEAYNPKYPIVINNGAYSADGIFDWAKITDTKVPLTLRKARFTIARASKMHTIRLLDVDETISNITFTNCTSLQNITIEGVIPKNVNAIHSPLAVASLKSIITHLKDYSGTESEFAYTVTFLTSAFEALEAEGATAEYNGVACTWAELIDNLKWNLAKA